MTIIRCERCWKSIEQKGQRKYCIPCRKIIDRENAKAYRDANAEKVRTRARELARERARIKREALKWEE